MALHDLGVCLEPEFVVRTDLCRECVWGIAAGACVVLDPPNRGAECAPADNFYEEEHVAQVQKYKDASHNGDTYTTWISKTWIVGRLPLSPSTNWSG